MLVIPPLLMALARASALALALGCAVLSAMALGGRFSPRLDILTHFAPFLLVGGALAGLAWLTLGRSGAVTPILAAVAMAASGLLVTPEVMRALWPRTVPAGDRTLKLIQFNLWGRNTDPEGTARWIAAQDADVLVLEEVGDASIPVVRALRRQYPHQITCNDPRPCPTVILSRQAPVAGGPLKAPDSPIGVDAVWARFAAAGGGEFLVVGVHLTRPLTPELQQFQAAILTEAVAAFPKSRLILAGDLNSTPWSFTLRRLDRALGLERRTRALASWPAGTFSRYRLRSPIPLLPIDHVYAGEAWRTVSVRRGPRLGSDHYPVVVTLRLVRPS